METARRWRRRKNEKGTWTAELQEVEEWVALDAKRIWIPTKGDEYVRVYLDRLHRAESSGWGLNRGHRRQHAMRIMIKRLLADLWSRWRAGLGLEVTEPYAVAKLGMAPHGG